jgi:predicted site-specific integrase-resolvase
LKVTHQTVRAWIKAGDLLACRFNGTLRVRKDDYRAYVNISRGVSNERVP